MKSYLETLIETKEILKDKRNWCQHAGRIETFDPTTQTVKYQYCLLGCMAHVCKKEDINVFEYIHKLKPVAYKLFPELYKNSVPYEDFSNLNLVAVNDRLGHDSVMKLLDIAIETENNKTC